MLDLEISPQTRALSNRLNSGVELSYANNSASQTAHLSSVTGNNRKDLLFSLEQRHEFTGLELSDVSLDVWIS